MRTSSFSVSNLYRPYAHLIRSSRQESYAQADKDTRTGARLDVGLHDLESTGSAKKNEGFFEKGLLKAMESDHLAGGSALEVKVVGNGHCHGS